MTYPVPPAPPDVQLEIVTSLVRYAQEEARWLDADRRAAESRGRDASSIGELAARWEFVAIALAETYDLADLLDPDSL